MIRVAAVVLVGGALLSACTAGRPPAAAPTSGTRSSSRSPTTVGPATQSAASTLRVVGLGDSVMAGTNCGCRGLVEEYAAALAARSRRTVHVDNLGADGAITGDVLHDLTADATTRSLVSRAEVVVLTVGANDLNPQLGAWRASSCDDACFRTPARQMGDNLARVVRSLQAARGGRNDHVLVTDYWNVFQDGRVELDTDGLAGLAWSARVTDAANDAICRAARIAGATCVDLLTPFKGSGERDPTPLLADDGDHPNAAGIKVIVDALMRATPGDL